MAKEVVMRKRAHGRLLALTAVALMSLPVAASPIGRSTLTFSNQSGQDALVRIAGPTAGVVEVPEGTRRTTAIEGGLYRIYVRYGSPGHYTYSRGNPFAVTENDREYEHVEITLHAVLNGNYGSRPSNEAEFKEGRE
jgi:hypothetical protein